MPETGESPRRYRQYRFTLPPGGTSVLLVRHGESAPVVDGVAPPSLDGQDDPPLAPQGREQATRLADRLAVQRIDAIYVSPLGRTRQTAAPLAARIGVDPVVVRDLREVFLGDWEGGAFRKHVADGHELALRMYTEHRWDVIPNAESDEDFGRRVSRALSSLVAAHPDGRILVVAHGGVIAKSLAAAIGSERTFALLPDNASISELAYVDGRCVVRRFNDTAHLENRSDDPSRSAQTEASTTDTRGAGPDSTGNVRSRRPSSSAPTTSSEG